MPGLPVPFADVRRAVTLWHQCIDEGYPVSGAPGTRLAVTEARERLGMADGTLKGFYLRLDVAVALGIEVRSWRGVDEEWAHRQVLRYRTYDDEFRTAESRFSRPGSARAAEAGAATGSPPPRQRSPAARAPSPTVEPTPSSNPLDYAAKIVPLLRAKPLTLEELAEKLKVDQMVAWAAVYAAHQQGASIVERAGHWHLDSEPPLGIHRAGQLEFTTAPDGTFTFAACGDQHLGSKYERLDCLGDYYDEIERREISVVLNAGNWIDGEASFNKHDLIVHGMDAQMQYLATNYPKRTGVKTYAVTGADHEGWYARREGVDVGRYAANVMAQAGRDDWFDMGYMESFIRVNHYSSGEGSMISLMHPGGGSAYALSYAPQKIVESFDGGDKPGCLLVGHYHKSGYNLIRNVHAMQTGCFQDQTVFMRQKKLSAHVGGCFVTIKVDPRTGAFVECSYTFRNYFVRDYYNGRWSQHGAVNLAPRVNQL